jgi:hypothetical protein
MVELVEKRRVLGLDGV